jgi:hypothetical protein
MPTLTFAKPPFVSNAATRAKRRKAPWRWGYGEEKTATSESRASTLTRAYVEEARGSLIGRIGEEPLRAPENNDASSSRRIVRHFASQWR